MRPLFEINYGKIEILSDCANNSQCIALATCEMAKSADLQKGLSHGILKARIIRQKKYHRCLHESKINKTGESALSKNCELPRIFCYGTWTWDVRRALND